MVLLGKGRGAFYRVNMEKMKKKKKENRGMERKRKGEIQIRPD